MEKQVFLSFDEILDKGRYYDVADFLFDLEREKKKIGEKANGDLQISIIAKLSKEACSWVVLKFFRLPEEERKEFEELWTYLFNGFLRTTGYEMVKRN